MKKTIWQQAAGNDRLKNHAKLCLESNVILHGPGRHGKWPDCEEEVLRDKDCRPGTLKSLRRFCVDMQEGDLVVLRQSLRGDRGRGDRGRASGAHGIAIVVGGYEWKEEFGHVPSNGDWDLEHTRRVRWIWKAPDGQPEKVPGLRSFGSTTYRVRDEKARCWVKKRIAERLETIDGRPQAGGEWPAIQSDTGIDETTYRTLKEILSSLEAETGNE